MRVNLIDPVLLTDQHLIAEHGELFVLDALFWHSFQCTQGIEISRLPRNYVLGAGHVRFFYNKGTYIETRAAALHREGVNRGFLFKKTLEVKWPEEYLNQWSPSAEDIALIKPRLWQRILTKRSWYTYNGKPMCELENTNLVKWYTNTKDLRSSLTEAII